ncbi:28S ribosomal protein S6, mitochondrial [Alligator mississippiensis]|uniref:Small ribosomal subunit protein bS6m n=1 Tax=Alligator mississippiensis TaxID=8496 RepID=A0A151ME44_ALLMI|nr:28S ribosomal protein S6, mitochondrial [Alligator mississippiensis]
MPRYELALILKVMQRPETAATLKRTVEALMERGAVVRNLENLGERSLPYKITKHSQRHSRGGYFSIDFEGPPTIISTMMDHLGRDIDIIRQKLGETDRLPSRIVLRPLLVNKSPECLGTEEAALKMMNGTCLNVQDFQEDPSSTYRFLTIYLQHHHHYLQFIC